MKTRSEIEAALKRIKPNLVKKFSVKEIGIFGSFISGRESEGSDIDILVAFNEPVGWEFIDLKDFLEEFLDLKVDLVTTEALKPRMRNEILQKVVYI